MSQETLFTGFEEKKLTNIGTKQLINNQEKNIKEKIKELEELKIFYYETQNQIINEYLSNNEKEKIQLMDFIKLSPHYDLNLNLEENLKRVTLIALINTKFRDTYPQLFIELDKNYDERKNAIKKSLKDLGYK